jgi:very-short-patch-repair endonuclease
VIRRDSAGRRRYLDAEWLLPTGEIVVLEVDGSHHLDIANWQEDMKRERSVVVSRRWVLRATTFEIRLEAATIAADLRALGVPSLSDLSESQRAI